MADGVPGGNAERQMGDPQTGVCPCFTGFPRLIFPARQITGLDSS